MSNAPSFPIHLKSYQTSECLGTAWSDVRTPDFAFQGISLPPRGLKKRPVFIIWRPARTPGRPFYIWRDSLLPSITAYMDAPDYDVVDLGPIDSLDYGVETTHVLDGEFHSVTNGPRGGPDRLEMLARLLDIAPHELAKQMQLAVDTWGPAHTVTDTWPLSQESALLPPKRYTAAQLRHLRICHAQLSVALFAQWLGLPADMVQAWEGEGNASGELSPTGAAARLLEILESRGRFAVGLVRSLG